MTYRYRTHTWLDDQYWSCAHRWIWRDAAALCQRCAMPFEQAVAIANAFWTEVRRQRRGQHAATIEHLQQERAALRQARQFKDADAIRDQLRSLGVRVEDAPLS